MPNHIHNLLKIHYHGGNKERLKEARARIGDGESAISFDFIAPYPERWAAMDKEYNEFPAFSSPEYDAAVAMYRQKWGTDRDGYNSGGYEWCRENWGTKWDAYSVKIEAEDDWSFVVRFQTAWSWPEKFIRKLLTEFPDFNVVFLSAGEGDWFAVYLNRNDEGGLTEQIWTKENDYSGIIRTAMGEAMNRDY